MSSGKAWGDLLQKAPLPAAIGVVTRANGEKRHAGGLEYRRCYEWRDYPAEAPMIAGREDPNDPESAETSEPARWWTPRSIGFRAKVLVNPTGGDVRLELQKYVGLHFAPFSVSDQEYLEGIADRVVEWDFRIVEEDGTRRDVDPPAVGGWERFYDLPNDCLVWLREEVRTAHLPKPPTKKSTKPVGVTALSAPEATNDAPEAEPPDS